MAVISMLVSEGAWVQAPVAPALDDARKAPVNLS